MAGVPLQSEPLWNGFQVDRFTFWRVDGSSSSVLSYLRAHPPRELSSVRASRSSVSYSRRGTRFLDVTVEKKLPGRVVIRVDAKVVWFFPRTAKVPAATHEIDVSAEQPDKGFVGPTGRHFGPPGTIRVRRVTDPAEVSKLVRWFDALPILPPGPSPSCGVEGPDPGIDLVFRAASGERLASAWVPWGWAGRCGTAIGFSIHAKEQHPLIDERGPPFSYRLMPLLGAKPPG
jgi:hypothetical protein